ncbi:hypothetical protein EML15_03555 [Corynebacterium sp. sy017]|uniref:DUF5318 family protein n=1 Tax=unclassified Corynebacterium TaxID=2624378 RepID=UPI0011850FB2|nr:MULTISPECIES: DUF5318 family protein [unclassified Corynebacterium]MBP3088224.1 hypothetical protein [Corynebacterium sp. sy017]QDZ43641.1 hypothetical protein FQV43_09855 [Corynebacterium sp. sy039]TSD92066.1 hypothetical protein ELY17_03555 [Corynebacterium sp. SY003]
MRTKSVQFCNVISHKLQRLQVLQAWRGGHIRREEICDADFILVTAAQHHGFSAPYQCPICANNQLLFVYWVYGDELGRISSSARTLKEIQEYVEKGKSFSIHTVEVCPVCRWNHVLEEAVATRHEE